MATGICIELAFGVALEVVRLERSMTVEDLATKTGIPAVTLSDYEAGVARASSAHVVLIALALQSSISRLFGLVA